METTTTPTPMDPTLAEYCGEDERDFASFMKEVDEVIVGRLGLSVFDLPDRNWRDMFDDGVCPIEAAEQVFEDLGGVL